MAVNFKKFKGRFHMGMGIRLTTSILVIVFILFLSSVISIIEFRRISTLVSDMVSDNIRDINLATDLAVASDKFNLELLSVVGEADFRIKSDIDHTPFRQKIDTTMNYFILKGLNNADSLLKAYDDYVATAVEVDSVIVSDFIDTREWYFLTLQPKYNNLRKWQDKVNEGIYDSLHDNSIDFDESFYRGVMPGVVSVFTAVALLLLLLFFIIVYYVRPIRSMLKNFEAYRHYSQPYHTLFEGNDELQELNGDIAECIEENILLKKRIRQRES